MNVVGEPVEVVGLYMIAILLNAAALLWAAGMAFRFRTIQAGPLMQIPVFLLLFFAPVYVPLDLLTGWIQTVATYNPITYMMEAGRGLISGAPAEVALAFALGLALIAAVRGLGVPGPPPRRGRRLGAHRGPSRTPGTVPR